LRGTQFNRATIVNQNNIVKQFIFENRNLNDFTNYEIAYHQLLLDIVNQQISSTNLVIHNSPVKKVFVDGGFSKNPIFMNLLAEAFPKMEVYAASMAQASALGAALAIHKSWNPKPIQNDLIDLKFYKH
jgi:glycerol kinase